MANPNRHKWLESLFQQDDVLTKGELIDNHIIYFMDRIASMFEWHGLPNTIPAKDLERLLMTLGWVAIKDIPEDKLLPPTTQPGIYATQCSQGDLPNAYERPNKVLITNAHLYVSGEYHLIGRDCEVIYNDYWRFGLLPLLRKYAILLAEAEISFRRALINSRFPSIIACDNDSAKEGIDQLFDAMEHGSPSHAIGYGAWFEGIKSAQYGQDVAGTLLQLTESIQYLKSSLFMELGLESNYNMKREAINGNEAGMNEDVLMPLIDEMLRERQEGCERVNKLYGTNWSVELGGVWKKARLEIAINELSEVDNANTTMVEEQPQEQQELSQEEDINESENNQEGAEVVPDEASEEVPENPIQELKEELLEEFAETILDETQITEEEKSEDTQEDTQEDDKDEDERKDN